MIRVLGLYFALTLLGLPTIAEARKGEITPEQWQAYLDTLNNRDQSQVDIQRPERRRAPPELTENSSSHNDPCPNLGGVLLALLLTIADANVTMNDCD